MTREELTDYISDTYGVLGDMPWEDSPTNVVFRHAENSKWFALIMDVECRRLGVDRDGTMDIVNLKCDSGMIVSLTKEPGIFPAYHMSKSNWITCALNDSLESGKLKALLDISFGLTEKKLSGKK